MGKCFCSCLINVPIKGAWYKREALLHYTFHHPSRNRILLFVLMAYTNASSLNLSSLSHSFDQKSDLQEACESVCNTNIGLFEADEMILTVYNRGVDWVRRQRPFTYEQVQHRVNQSPDVCKERLRGYFST